jgi:hypothetical protein
VALPQENALIQVNPRVFLNLKRAHLYRNLPYNRKKVDEGQTKAWVMDERMDGCKTNENNKGSKNLIHK